MSRDSGAPRFEAWTAVQDEDAKRMNMAEHKGLAIGICLGVALGAATGKLAIGLALGVALGVGLDSVRGRRDR